ncbi:unnamed protein product [Nesidiocoris tenuis]|uniref:Uncharacterized protein n=1 Tax=Nesidiocoris tenuis TaxID=355587 RepID=A0A6H5HES9_9HEMI|nr:unnamed protein product [Nesidiocoris tenuis]
MPQECLRTIAKARLALMLPSATGLVLSGHLQRIILRTRSLPGDRDLEFGLQSEE